MHKYLVKSQTFVAVN